MLSGRTSLTRRLASVTYKKAVGQVQSVIFTGKAGPEKVKKDLLIPKSEPSLKALSSIGADGANLRVRCLKSIHANFGLLPLLRMRLNKRAMMVIPRTLTVRGAAWCSPTLSAAKTEIYPTSVCGPIILLKWQRSTDCRQAASRPSPANWSMAPLGLMKIQCPVNWPMLCRGVSQICLIYKGQTMQWMLHVHPRWQRS